MKEIIFKFLRGVLYFLWWLFIIIIITTLFDWWNLIYWLLWLLFWFWMLPFTYSKVKEFIFKKFEKISKIKFILSYVSIVFFWYFLFFWMLTSWIATIQQNEKQEIENKTKLSIEFNENQSFTLKDNLDIKIIQENIKKLTINWKDINIESSNFLYKYPLNLWKNTISIIWYNWDVKREFNKEIEKITKEEEQKRIELEQQKLALEKQRLELEQQKAIEEQKQKEELAKKQAELQEQERVKKAVDRMNKEIDWINKYNWSTYRDSVASIQIEIALFSAYASIVDEYINDSNPTIKNLATQLKTKVSNLQKKEFPQIRKAYADLVSKTMWEHNIDVLAKWTWYSTIELVWWIYANNKNIKDSYVLIADMLKLLRFDRANFKWYKYDDEYTYYDIESLSDDKVEQIK